MSASALEWVPESLYNTAISTLVTRYTKFRRELKTLPENVQFDIYYKLYIKGRLCQLGMEFSELDTFAKILRVNDKRHLLHHCFQALMDHGVKVCDILSEAYAQNSSLCSSDTEKEKAIQLGFSLGNFLSDAGWLYAAERVYQACVILCEEIDDMVHWCKTLDCHVRLMRVKNANCKYLEALLTWERANEVLQKVTNAGHAVNRAALYAERCALLFAQSKYDVAFNYAADALKELSSAVPHKAAVDVLRQCAKACVVKREFKRAEMLIKYAVQYAREHFGPRHHKYSDTLLDYGFFLLNVDAITQAVQVYQAALDIRQSVFGGYNLYVAIAHEDLAYSSYVHEYSSGRFKDAADHAETAIKIITQLLPEDHLLLASSKRVKALILEEIAIDSHNKEDENRLLHEAEDLHLASLALAQKAFGEDNVQTAKHYGNLGRLYQSMHRFEEAEEMHLKAIMIKEKLLGPEDYEVALSVGHLASLYNYDMRKYDEAEKLYLRSIAIGQKLFGPGYSGLEYDYRGLLRLYDSIDNDQKALEFRNILHEWNQLRDRSMEEEHKPLEFERFTSTQEVIEKFFSLPANVVKIESD